MADMYKIIDTLLQERNISGAKMSADLGMSRSFMTELRKGRAKSIKLETAQKIADYFGVSVGYLLGNDEDSRALEKAKLELTEFANSNPNAVSGKRLDVLFNASGYDHVIVCFNLGIDQNYLDSWMDANELPPKPIIDKILGVFRLKPEDLLSSNELADYNSEAQEWGPKEKAPTKNSERAKKQDINILRIAGRDGSYQERALTDEQLAALKAILDQMPDVPEDL